jgi:hypothetical protein
LAIHYGLAFTAIKRSWSEDSLYFEKMWNYAPTFIILPTAFYITGNLVVYAAFIYSFKQPGNMKHDILP